MKLSQIYKVKFIVTCIITFNLFACKEEPKNINTVSNTIKIDEVLDLESYQLTQIGKNKIDFTKDLLIIDFWATWCAPCIANFPKFNDIQKKYKNKIQIIAVNDETKEKTESFLKSKKYNFPFSIDSRKELFKKFDVKSLPITIILNKQGKFIWSGNSSNLESAINSYITNKSIPEELIDKTSPLVSKYYNNIHIKTTEKELEYYITNSTPSDKYFALSQKNLNAPINIRYVAVPVIDIIHDLKNINYTRIFNKRLELNTLTINLLAKSQYENLTYGNFSKRIISDLESIYAVKIEDKKEQKEVFELNIKNTNKLTKALNNTQGGGMVKVENDTLIITRLSLKQLTSYLEGKLNIPFNLNSVNEKKYDFKFDSNILNNKKLLKQELYKYGIEIKKIVKYIDVVYIN